MPAQISELSFLYKTTGGRLLSGEPHSSTFAGSNAHDGLSTVA
jgi:hypothetical protein